MALFTDGDISDISDLYGHDSGVLEVARAEGIDLNAKLDLAGVEIAAELEEFLARRLGGPSGVRRAVPTLDQVVVTSPLKQWHTLRTLELIYGDVRGNHVGSRYEAKWDDFRRRALWISESLFRIGIGLTNRPLPKAEEPLVRVESGEHPAATYYVQVAWTNSQGEAGAPSDVVVYSVPVNSRLVVAMPAAPDGISGFNVFVGEDPSQSLRQNSYPMAIGTEWMMSANGLVPGPRVGTGQTPDWYLRNDRVLRRG